MLRRTAFLPLGTNTPCRKLAIRGYEALLPPERRSSAPTDLDVVKSAGYALKNTAMKPMFVNCNNAIP